MAAFRFDTSFKYNTLHPLINHPGISSSPSSNALIALQLIYQTYNLQNFFFLTKITVHHQVLLLIFLLILSWLKRIASCFKLQESLLSITVLFLFKLVSFNFLASMCWFSPSLTIFSPFISTLYSLKFSILQSFFNSLLLFPFRVLKLSDVLLFDQGYLFPSIICPDCLHPQFFCNNLMSNHDEFICLYDVLCFNVLLI